MNVPCPQCQALIEVPAALMRQGVVRVSCNQCDYLFVLRLGDPGSPPPAKNFPAPQVSNKGFKSSLASQSAVGEIGIQQPKFIASDTQTLVKLDPDLLQEVRQVSDEVLDQDPTEKILRIDPFFLTSETPAPEPLLLSAKPPTEADPDPTEVGLGESAQQNKKFDSSKGFESFRSIDQPPPPPPGAEVPRVNATTGAAVSSDVPSLNPAIDGARAGATSPETFIPLPKTPIRHVASPPSTLPRTADAVMSVGNAPTVEPIPSSSPLSSPDPAGFTSKPAAVYATTNVGPTLPPASLPYPPNGSGAMIPVLEVIPWQAPSPPPATGLKIFSLLMSLTLSVGLIFVTFILYRNDWSLDFANFGTMVERALGLAPKSQIEPVFQRVEVSPPLVEEAKLASGQRILMAQGSLKNKDQRARKYLYIRALIKDRHGRTTASEEFPADNLFNKETLATLTKAQLLAHLNPAGQNKRNEKLNPGETLDYMVVLSDLPVDYTPLKYRISVELSQAEFFMEP